MLNSSWKSAAFSILSTAQSYQYPYQHKLSTFCGLMHALSYAHFCACCVSKGQATFFQYLSNMGYPHFVDTLVHIFCAGYTDCFFLLKYLIPLATLLRYLRLAAKTINGNHYSALKNKALISSHACWRTPCFSVRKSYIKGWRVGFR